MNPQDSCVFWKMSSLLRIFLNDGKCTDKSSQSRNSLFFPSIVLSHVMFRYMCLSLDVNKNFTVSMVWHGLKTYFDLATTLWSLYIPLFCETIWFSGVDFFQDHTHKVQHCDHSPFVVRRLVALPTPLSCQQEHPSFVSNPNVNDVFSCCYSSF